MLRSVSGVIQKNRALILFIVLMMIMILLAYWASDQVIKHLDSKIYQGS